MHNPETSRPKDEAIDSDATSKETLKDVEANEKDSDSIAAGNDNKAPAPDGLFDDNAEKKETEPI